MMTTGIPAGGARNRWATFAIILSVSAVLAYIYFRQVGSPYALERIELHERILGGAAESPYRYRVLVPCLAEGLTRALSAALPGGKAFLLSYALLDLAAILLLLGALYRYLRAWFTSDQALIGVLFAAATMPMALRDHYYQPWSVLEAGLFAAGLLCIRDRLYVLLALIVALASFNRETAVFIPLAFLVCAIGENGTNAGNGESGAHGASGAGDAHDISRRKLILLFAAYVAIWGAVFFGLRWFFGEGPRVVSARELLARNTIRPALFRTSVHLALIFGAFWVFAALGFRRSPAFVKRTVLLAPAYLVAIALWGVWYEVRLLMPLYAIVVPLGLSFLYRDCDALHAPPSPDHPPNP
jgi:hypothetical protein